MSGCDTYLEAISAYIDRELDDDAGAELFAHLGTCVSCRRSFASLSALHTQISAAPAPEVPSSLDRRIHRLHATPAARASRLNARVHSFWSQRLSVPAPAFAIMLLAATATLLFSLLLLRTTPPQPAGEQQVMYIMNMPAVVVEGTPEHPAPHIQ
jgi:anti-sigma factor RsiW